MPMFGERPVMLSNEQAEFFPMYYNHELKLFTIGGKDIALTDPMLIDETKDPSADPSLLEDIEKHPVLIGIFGNPIATPGLYAWLNSENFKELEDTKGVMRDAYIALEVASTLDAKSIPLSSFKASLQREGHLRLRVVGSCACLGTNPQGDLIEDDEWDTGYVEYVFHNNDGPEQRLSLLAGLGHLATCCVKSE